MRNVDVNRARQEGGSEERAFAGPSAEADGVLELVYDKQCPVCDFYCRRVRVEQGAGRLALVDARDDSAAMRAITTAGLDIDQGMVLKTGDKLYYGSDAICELARLSSRRGWFNRVNRALFSSAARSRLLYPALRSLRNLLLKALRKTKVNNLGLDGNERF